MMASIRNQDFEDTTHDCPALKIAVRIFDEQQRRHLIQIMMLVSQRQPGAMVMVPAAEAEVVFIEPSEPGADVFMRNAMAGKRPLPVVYGDREVPGLPWLARPARSNDFLGLLETLPGLLKQRQAASATPQPAEGAHLGLLETHDFVVILDYLYRLNANHPPVVVKTDNGSLFIDPQQRKAFVPRESAGFRGNVLLAMAYLGKTDIQPVSRATLEVVMADANREVLSLEALSWSLALLANPRTLPPAAMEERRFRLRHWPNFSRLEHNRQHLVWAGMLIRQPMNFAMLISRSSQGFVPLGRFYNACVLSGLLVQTEQTRGRVANVASTGQRSGIFKRLLAKLAG